MQSQSCCADLPHNKDDTDAPDPRHLKLTLSSSGKYLPCQPYQVAELANAAYRQLFHQFAGSKFLDVQLPPDSEGVSELEGYYKMANFDACYHGEWRDHHPHGRGMATLANGALLVGTFVQGSCTGDYNYFFFRDGSTYTGNIIGNRISGKGKLTTSGLVYKGEWHDNLPHGSGSETYANGDKFIGTFERGVKQGEECIFTWANNENFLEYRGGFWSGRIQGMGTLTLRDKTVIHGFFDGNCISNLTLTNNKVKFIGSFEVGKASGKGTL
ncbi:phosphatidylinositol 4-phosphate 5-kinase 6-like [Nymphaea colorata]|uniref:phosphatidylinositol 4-phosphate 5-kinase 6-like n=1 Tax=Nymphaea colorata TaxID=210225 RepID=UPI00129DB6A2|nr:phosphatidylinositol 4-phosphate 5-kinase 6-like [Nymphaea colorata]